MLKQASWTRVLPKSGNTFRRVINHLNSINIQDNAKQYAELQKTVIDARLASLTLLPQSSSAWHGASGSVLRPLQSSAPSPTLPPPQANETLETGYFEDTMSSFDEFVILAPGGESQYGLRIHGRVELTLHFGRRLDVRDLMGKCDLRPQSEFHCSRSWLSFPVERS
jgi:hypothetical protein